MEEVTFSGRLQEAGRGGHVVVVDPKVAAEIGAKARTRVRGTFAGVPYRSNLMSMGGLMLGVHKATLEAAGVQIGGRVQVTMRLDEEPRPDEIVPEDLAGALARSPRAAAAWERLAPSRRREHIQGVLGAKQPETRRRRIAKSVAALEASAPA